MDKELCEIKLDNFVYKQSKNKELDRSVDEKHSPKMIHEEVIWFYFQGVMKHTSHNTKKIMKLLHSLLKF